MNTLKRVGGLSALVAGMLMAGNGYAVPAFDAETGVGFVPKGDVQYTFNWNNHLLQYHAEDIAFRVGSEVVSEVSWTCTNSNNEQTQERKRTTTTKSGGVLKSVGRRGNQITGFVLDGWDGEASDAESQTDGPPLNSCPSGPWSLTSPADDPEILQEIAGFQVSQDGGATWQPLVWKED